MSSPRASGVLVIVPTYNERATVAELVQRLLAVGGVELLVVDDSSPDETAAVVRRLAQERSSIHLIQRLRKGGLGSAYVEGFRWALDRDYWAVIQMDGDLSHDPADVPRLLDALERADLVLGSRYVKGGRIENWGPVRRALSKAGNVYARTWLGWSVADWTSGFRAYRVSLLAALALHSVRSDGYAFQVEMTRRVAMAGGRIVEIPIKFVERAAGRSKMSWRIIVEALVNVTGWGIQDRVRSRRSIRELKGLVQSHGDEPNSGQTRRQEASRTPL